MREGPSAGCVHGGALIIYQLVVEGTEPALVAAERGMSRPLLVEQLRDAVDALAVAYEDTVNACLDWLRAPDQRSW
jgi:hypothetical protein